MGRSPFIRWFSEINARDVAAVGGKVASLGELLRLGVKVPYGFAITVDAWRYFVELNQLAPRINEYLSAITDFEDTSTLQHYSSYLWRLVHNAPMPEGLKRDIVEAYHTLEQDFWVDVDVAVRSSAIAEDSEGASFAGEHDTFLNIRGEQAIIEAVRDCFASLFKDNALYYRHHHHLDITAPEGIAVGVQRMARSDEASSGVIFTIEPFTLFPNLICISSSWGLGEPIVQGDVTPDVWSVFKPFLDAGTPAIIGRELGAKEFKLVYAYRKPEPTEPTKTTSAERTSWSLTEDEVLELARIARRIEQHYGKPMDIEWAKDGDGRKVPHSTGELLIVQARPVVAIDPETKETKDPNIRRHLMPVGDHNTILTGIAASRGKTWVGRGRVQVMQSVRDKARFQAGNVLVAPMTAPPWVPIMRKASGIVTDRGGKTCHAAIVARELGIPCIVGTRNATSMLSEDQEVSVDCTKGTTGRVLEGIVPVEERSENLHELRTLRARSRKQPSLMFILGDPVTAFEESFCPNDGIGLARLEFILANVIGIHPRLVFEDNVREVLGLLKPKNVVQEALANSLPAALVDRLSEYIEEATEDFLIELTKGYPDLRSMFIGQLSEGIAQLAASVWPKPIIVRTSDFKTNEYRELLGGARYTPQEDNPMLGERGCSLYHTPEYKPSFFLECEAIRRAREDLGFTNIAVMLPFPRTPEEVDEIYRLMAEGGLRRGEHGLKMYMMAEIPSVLYGFEEFAERFDGFSIGSNDLFQLLFGIDRDNERVASITDERHPIMLRALRDLLRKAKRARKPIGFCGQAPSFYPEITEFLIKNGISSVSVTPDAMPNTIRIVADAQRSKPK